MDYQETSNADKAGFLYLSCEGGRSSWAIQVLSVLWNTTGSTREGRQNKTGLDVEIRSILNVVSNLLSPRLHTLAIVLLASVVAGELCACDDLETLEWVPLADPLPQMAFEADECIIERYRQTKLERGLPVDPGFACGGNQ